MNEHLCLFWIQRWWPWGDPWWLCLNPGEWASWVQAIGSVAAIWFGLTALRREAAKDRVVAAMQQAEAQRDLKVQEEKRINELDRQVRRTSALVKGRSLDFKREHLLKQIDQYQAIEAAARSLVELLLVPGGNEWPMEAPVLTPEEIEDFRNRLTAIEIAGLPMPATYSIIKLRQLLQEIVVRQQMFALTQERCTWVRQCWANASGVTGVANKRFEDAVAKLEALDLQIAENLRDLA